MERWEMKAETTRRVVSVSVSDDIAGGMIFGSGVACLCFEGPRVDSGRDQRCRIGD